MIGPAEDVGRQEIRFWRRVGLCAHSLSRIGAHYDDCTTCCWLWQGAVNEHGYGRTRYQFADRDECYAHRVAWRFAHGRLPLPLGMDASHRCDVPRCSNPAHLEVKPHQVNMAEMAVRGRANNGQHGGFRPRKLTWGKVEELRSLAMTHRYTCKQLGGQFGVSAQMISDILCGRSWGKPSEH